MKKPDELALKPEHTDAPVELMQPGVLYIIGEWMVELLCPCGCQRRVSLPLLSSVSPRWSHDGKGTIMPSVDMIDGCRSHYWITSYQIRWT